MHIAIFICMPQQTNVHTSRVYLSQYCKYINHKHVNEKCVRCQYDKKCANSGWLQQTVSGGWSVTIAAESRPARPRVAGDHSCGAPTSPAEGGRWLELRGADQPGYSTAQNFEGLSINWNRSQREDPNPLISALLLDSNLEICSHSGSTEARSQEPLVSQRNWI